jgi:hypothetical protein
MNATTLIGMMVDSRECNDWLCSLMESLITSHPSAKGTTEALKSTCVAVSFSSANLHCPANMTDLNHIEQVWEMVKGSINDEQSNTCEERSAQARATWTGITLKFVNWIVVSFSTQLRAFFGPKRKSLIAIPLS